MTHKGSTNYSDKLFVKDAPHPNTTNIKRSTLPFGKFPFFPGNRLSISFFFHEKRRRGAEPIEWNSENDNENGEKGINRQIFVCCQRIVIGASGSRAAKLCVILGSMEHYPWNGMLGQEGRKLKDRTDLTARRWQGEAEELAKWSPSGGGEQKQAKSIQQLSMHCCRCTDKWTVYISNKTWQPVQLMTRNCISPPLGRLSSPTSSGVSSHLDAAHTRPIELIRHLQRIGSALSSQRLKKMRMIFYETAVRMQWDRSGSG